MLKFQGVTLATYEKKTARKGYMRLAYHMVIEYRPKNTKFLFNASTV